MKNVDDYNLALTSDNVNTLMQRVLDRIKANSVIDAPLDWSLATAINHEMQNLAQILDEQEISEMKHYEFSCEIELYPLVQYIEANSAEEAIELMEQKIDVDFINDLVPSDFHCVDAHIVKETKEYKNWRNSTRKFQEG